MESSWPSETLLNSSLVEAKDTIISLSNHIQELTVESKKSRIIDINYNERIEMLVSQNNTLQQIIKSYDNNDNNINKESNISNNNHDNNNSILKLRESQLLKLTELLNISMSENLQYQNNISSLRLELEHSKLENLNILKRENRRKEELRREREDKERLIELLSDLEDEVVKERRKNHSNEAIPQIKSTVTISPIRIKELSYTSNEIISNQSEFNNELLEKNERTSPSKNENKDSLSSTISPRMEASTTEKLFQSVSLIEELGIDWSEES